MSWVRAGNLAVPYYSPSQFGPVVFMNAVREPAAEEDNPPADQFLPDIWHEASIPDSAPADAVMARIFGILIISHPGRVVNGAIPTADLHVRLRRALGPDNGYMPGYVGQVCEAQPGGVRSPFSAWVALEGRKFEWHWTRTTPPPYPENPSYGIVLWVDMVACQ